MDDELAAHEPVGLRVACSLESAARKVAHEMAAHLVDHRLHRLVFAGQRRLLGEANIFAAAQRILDLCYEQGDRHAERRVEGRAEERLLEPSLHVEEDLEQAVQEFEEHRKARSPLLVAGGARLRRNVTQRTAK